VDKPADLLTRRFTRILERELVKLPAEPRDSDLGSWVGQGGWIDTHLARAESYLRGVVEHRVRRALALVDACCAVEPAGGS
jgi:hypothetical protein